MPRDFDSEVQTSHSSGHEGHATSLRIGIVISYHPDSAYPIPYTIPFTGVLCVPVDHNLSETRFSGTDEPL